MEMELKDNRYIVGGISLTKCAEEYGTPIYVYHAEKIISQYEKLKNAFPGLPLQIKYACKALNNINILRLLHEAGAGLDAVSIHEVELGIKAGFSPEEILFTPNGVSFE